MWILYHAHLDTRARATGGNHLKVWWARRRVCYLHNTQWVQQTNIHRFSGIWSRNPSNKAVSDLPLRLHGHRHLLSNRFFHILHHHLPFQSQYTTGRFLCQFSRGGRSYLGPWYRVSSLTFICVFLSLFQLQYNTLIMPWTCPSKYFQIHLFRVTAQFQFSYNIQQRQRHEIKHKISWEMQRASLHNTRTDNLTTVKLLA